MSRKKLLVLSSTYPRWLGDPEPGFVHELAKRLTTQFDVRVLCPHARGAAPRETFEGVQVRRYRYAPSRLETLVNDGGIVNNLKRQPWKWLLVPSFLLGLFWCAWREIRRWHPDVIHAHWLLPQGLIVALLDLLDRHTPPFLVTSHGADLFALRARPLTALKRFVVSRAAALTVVSQTMTGELARIGVSAQKVCVLPMGVDITHRFTPMPDQPRSHDEILFVGRLVEKKGLRYLLAAMPEIIARHPAAFLTIVGFGPEEGERRAQAEALGLAHKVKFLGPLAQVELPDLYRRAAVFVAPFVRAESGDQEGLPVTLMEAIACGCPVVVGELEAMADLFEPDEADLRVISTNIQALAEHVIATLEHPREACRRADRMRVRLSQRLSWDTIARQYAGILRGVLAIP
ncbi:MAG: glycosyltransferase [Candidatus Competibacteraceae bacterium]|nr:MAG: glycosyltransferase [Candidatus Competibacteraceae bacterium]